MAIEIYEHIHGLLPGIMGEVFEINRTLPKRRVPKTLKYGTEAVSFLAPKVWALVQIIKECYYLKDFKSKISI